MSALSYDKLKMLCPDSWAARTYGEYLASCAEDQANLIAQCSDAIANETVATKINEISTEFHGDFDLIQDTITQELINAGKVDVVDFDWQDPDVVSIFNQQYESNASFKFACDDFAVKFPHTNISGSNLYNLLNTPEDDIIYDRSDLINVVNTVTQSILTENHYPADFQFTLNGGFVNFKDMLKSMILQSNLELTESLITLPAYSGSGSSIGNITLSTEDIMDEMKTNFASATSWAYGFISMASDNVTEALASFEANVETVIADTKERFAASVATVKATIAGTKANASAFIKRAEDMLGWSKVIDETFTTVNETDIASYTGASPLSAINIHCAADAITAVGNTLLQVGKGIWQGIKAIGEKLWNKAKPYVMAITDNPVDIAVQDDHDDTYTIGNFKFQATGVRSNLIFNPDDVSDMSEFLSGTCRPALLKFLDKYITINTFFGELSIKPWNLTEYSGDNCFQIQYDIVFRPKCLNYRSLLNYGVAYVSDPGTVKEKIAYLNTSTGWSDFASWLNSGELYADDEEDEEYKYMGFISAIHLMIAMFSGAVADLSTQMKTEYGWRVESYDIDYWRHNDWEEYNSYGAPSNWYQFFVGQGRTVPSTVTNLDFIKVACGARQISSDYYFDAIPCYNPKNVGEVGDNSYITDIGVFGDYLLTLLLYQGHDRIQHPGDFLYLPYSSNGYDFSAGRYRIKTDAENANIANVIANVIITVTVILIAIIICKAAIKIFRKNKFMNMTATVGRLDNKMWNGKSLTRKEKRQYIRYNRKLQKMNYFSSGFAGAVSTAASNSSNIAALVKNTANAANVDLFKTVATGKVQQKQADSIALTKSDVNSLIQDQPQIKADLTTTKNKTISIEQLIKG